MLNLPCVDFLQVAEWSATLAPEAESTLHLVQLGDE